MPQPPIAGTASILMPPPAPLPAPSLNDPDNVLAGQIRNFLSAGVSIVAASMVTAHVLSPETIGLLMPLIAAFIATGTVLGVGVWSAANKRRSRKAIVMANQQAAAPIGTTARTVVASAVAKVDAVADVVTAQHVAAAADAVTPQTVATADASIVTGIRITNP